MSKFKTDEEYFAFSKRLVVIPIQDILDLLKKSKIQLPSFVHRFLLKETIRDKVFEEKIYNTYTDELQYRLRGYDDFSVYLLEKLIEKFNLDFDITRYKELLFNFLFLNRNIIKISKSFLNELEQLQHNYTVDLEIISYATFIELFSEIFHDVDGYIDGVKITKWTDDVLTSYTLGDLKGLSAKYGVKIPRRINKTILIEILAAKFKLSEEEKTELNKQSVLELEMYAKEKGFNISIDLKKSDMIEFIKYKLNLYHNEVHPDEYNYNIPLVLATDAVEEDMKPLEEEKPIVTQVPIEEEVETITTTDKEEAPEPEPMEQKEEPLVIPENLPEETEPESEPEQMEPEVVESEQPQPKIIKTKPRFTQNLDESLLSREEKDLLDEKINIIIKKYYKKRRRRRIILSIVIALVAVILGFAVYSYIYYTNTGNLPFGL